MVKLLNQKNRSNKKLKWLISFILIVSVFSVVVCPCFGDDIICSETYGGVDDDIASEATVQTSDGGYAVFGDTESFGVGQSDFWIIKTDADGNMQWNKTYGGASIETSGGMCATTDGGYIMCGSTASFGAGGYDAWLVKVDSDGNMEWDQTYGGTDNEYGNHVIQTVDGGYALGGRTLSYGTGADYFWLVKVDADGNMEWDQTYGGAGSEYGMYVIQTNDGGYALVGHTSSVGAGSYDVWLVKTDASGNMLWDQVYGGTELEWGQCLAQTSDGGYAIAGTTASFGAGERDFWLVKVDADGNLEWDQTYGGTGNDGANYFIQTDDSGYAIVGFTTVGSDQNATLIKTDVLGNMEWNQTYGGAGTETAYALLKTNDGYYLLTLNTRSYGAGHDDIWLVEVIPETSTIGGVILLAIATTLILTRTSRKSQN